MLGDNPRHFRPSTEDRGNQELDFIKKIKLPQPASAPAQRHMIVRRVIIGSFLLLSFLDVFVAVPIGPYIHLVFRVASMVAVVLE